MSSMRVTVVKRGSDGGALRVNVVKKKVSESVWGERIKDRGLWEKQPLLWE